MATRLLILDILDPRGQTGLSVAVQTAAATGADEILPVTTGIMERSAEGAVSVRSTPARGLRRVLDEAFQRRVDGLLVGLLPSYWQARALSQVLAKALPETLVYAPGMASGGSLGERLGGANRRSQVAALLPETTVALLPAPEISSLLGLPETEDQAALAQQLLDAGAYAAWVRGNLEGARAVDFVAYGERTAVLDYPQPVGPAAAATASGALATLLALGCSLEESVDRAHRLAAHVDQSTHAPAVRG
ncbi:MAG TPA: bifunctional hydroxymethylpyrimidine kinase/phosphomethylpyrimidine kinase [Acidobacteriota bacterium]|nr:bifunctional hydroxymethylpyrimidine kinase/phosphomethylpyrimidine kinase [Acidobacteriota bacterium]